MVEKSSFFLLYIILLKFAFQTKKKNEKFFTVGIFYSNG